MKLSDLFYLHKSDRISIFFLLALIAIVVGVVWLVGSQQTSTQLTAEDSWPGSCQRHNLSSFI